MASLDLRIPACSREAGNGRDTTASRWKVATPRDWVKRRGFTLANHAEVALPALDRSLVAGLPVFQGLTPEQQDDVLGEAQSVRYPKGADVFQQDQEAQHFF